MDEEGMQVSCTLHFNLKWSEISAKTKNWHGCFEINSISNFNTALGKLGGKCGMFGPPQFVPSVFASNLP